jgi:formamidopyrimidine-DNA glycosylase
MPELAEVDYYRRQWDEGHGEKITRVHLHGEKRIFRGTDTKGIEKLVGTKLLGSEASGKQMMFRFSGDIWLGLHLGMTGKLSAEAARYEPAKHDHLVLYQRKRALVFNDMRQFGRVLVHEGKEPPVWWSSIGTSVTSDDFTLEMMKEFLEKHGRLPIKSALLLQKGFPGIGNWMADEILWRAGLNPHRPGAKLKSAELKNLWKEVRFVAREALSRISRDYGDVPAGWLFHERWKRKGICPKHKKGLRKESIGGRTSAWCERCQK